MVSTHKESYITSQIFNILCNQDSIQWLTPSLPTYTDHVQKPSIVNILENGYVDYREESNLQFAYQYFIYSLELFMDYHLQRLLSWLFRPAHITVRRVAIASPFTYARWISLISHRIFVAREGIEPPLNKVTVCMKKIKYCKKHNIVSNNQYFNLAIIN